MPNWCDCDLTVTGPAETLAAFREHVQETRDVPHKGPFSADKLIPYPNEFAKADEAARLYNEEVESGKRPRDPIRPFGPKDGFNFGGYDWCVKHWGTKWGLCDCTLKTGPDGELLYSFQTAWSPPRPVIAEAAAVFPALTFDLRYFERGAEFQGVFRCARGKVAQDTTSSYTGPRGG